MNHLRKPVQVNQVPQGNTTAKDINRPQIECWVPRCSSNLEHFPTKTFYSLPKDPVLRDLWLAATGKKYHLPLQNIWFCENHFDINKETKEASFPVCKMPQKICRTCLAPIHDKKYCILSSNIKSKMPESVEQIFGCATSVPLIDILQFCVPEMPIEMNPIPVSCDSCYRNIWIYYLFKNKCIYKEKAIEEEFYPGKYGNLVGCRACPSTDHTNLILLSENSELGILLSSMFSNLYSPSILPLKVCPACISALKGIQEFRKVLSRAQDYFKRHYKNPPQNEAIQDKPTVVAVNAKDTAQKQLLLGKLMLEKGLGLKDKCVSETHQAIIWNSIQKGFMLYGCHYSIQNLKDTWSMIILEYTLGRLKGTELGDILSQYMRAESPKVASKPLKKRYRTPSMDSGFDSSTTQAAAQNVTVEQNITPYRINPEPIGIFEPNIIPPPSCSATTSVPPPYPAPPPYAMSNADESDASTVTCSPVVEPDTPVSITAENSVPAQGYQASYNEFLFNIGTAKLDRKNKQASTERVASNIAENSKLKQPFESSMQNKCPQASYMSTSASSLSKTESAKETDNQSSLNSVIHSGTGQRISLMPKATTSFYSSGTTALGIKAVTSQRSNTGSVVLDRDKSDASKYPFKVEQNVGNSCVASSTISVIKSAIPSAVIDLTEDEDNMVQVANISSSWEAQSPEDTAGNEVSQVPNNIEIIETSTDNATSAAEVGRPIDTLATRGVVIEGDQIDKVGVASEASTSKARKTNDTCPDAQTATKRNVSLGSRKQKWLKEEKLEFVWTLQKHFLTTNQSHFRGWNFFLETVWKNSEIKNKIPAECMYSRWRGIYIDFRNGRCDPDLADAVFEFVQMLESNAIKLPKFFSKDTVGNLTVLIDKKNDLAMEEVSKCNDAEPLISSDSPTKGKQNESNTALEKVELGLTKYKRSFSDCSAPNLNSTKQRWQNKEKLEFVALLQEHFLASNPKNFRGWLPFLEAAWKNSKFKHKVATDSLYYRWRKIYIDFRNGCCEPNLTDAISEFLDLLERSAVKIPKLLPKDKVRNITVLDNRKYDLILEEFCKGDYAQSQNTSNTTVNNTELSVTTNKSSSRDSEKNEQKSILKTGEWITTNVEASDSVSKIQRWQCEEKLEFVALLKKHFLATNQKHFRSWLLFLEEAWKNKNTKHKVSADSLYNRWRKLYSDFRNGLCKPDLAEAVSQFVELLERNSIRTPRFSIKNKVHNLAELSDKKDDLAKEEVSKVERSTNDDQPFSNTNILKACIMLDELEIFNPAEANARSDGFCGFENKRSASVNNEWFARMEKNMDTVVKMCPELNNTDVVPIKTIPAKNHIDRAEVASSISEENPSRNAPEKVKAEKNNIFDRVDIEQKIKTTEISRLCWTREEDMKFLDALIVEFGRVKERPMKDIWANLGSEAAFSSKTATNLAAHWCDLMKTYTKSSLDEEFHEKMSHCMELWKQYIGNSSNASKRPDSDDKDMVLVKNMMHFLDDCDVFDEDWTVVLRKMSAYEEFAGYSYLDLKMHWKSLYHRFKFGMGALNLRADVKMEFSSLLVLMKKLKIRKFWDPWIVTNKRVSGRDSPFVPKKKRKKKFKRIVKSHQSFSFQDKVHLIDAIRCEYEVSRNKGVVSANPWRSIISKLHQVMYDNWDENRLWRMWSQMRLSAKIHAKDGSDYVDTEVWNLLERHNNYLKNRKKQQQNLGSSLSCPPEKNSDKQCNLEEKLDKQDDTLPVACASIDSPSKKVQTLISSYCTVEKSDKRVDSPTRVQSSSTCASVDEHSDLKPSDAKESVKLDEKPSQAKMDILTIEIDSDSDFSDGNNDSRDAAAKASLSPNVKTWTESEKNIFFKSVKIEFGKMLKNNEKISNPWKTIIKKLNRSQYSMYTFKELDKVWRKIRMDAHLHENNNAMFVTPLDTEVNRLIKLFHTIKEAKRTSKLTNAKSAEKPETKHDSDPKDAGKSKPAAPEKRKRKKRPLTLTKVKKDKKPKLALPPLDPNRLEEDKEAAEKTPWSEKELNDLISIIESTGNEVFKPDVPKQFWNNVRTKLIENGHSERSVGALYYKWNRLLESAKMAWADQKAPNKFDEVVIKFLAGVIRRNEKKPYCPEKNEEMKDATKSNVPGEIIKDKQQSELHSVDQNKSGRAVICDTSSSTNKNNEKCTIKENKQENVGSEPEENEMEDDASESEDEYVSAADIMKM